MASVWVNFGLSNWVNWILSLCFMSMQVKSLLFCVALRTQGQNPNFQVCFITKLLCSLSVYPYIFSQGYFIRLHTTFDINWVFLSQFYWPRNRYICWWVHFLWDGICFCLCHVDTFLSLSCIVILQSFLFEEK